MTSAEAVLPKIRERARGICAAMNATRFYEREKGSGKRSTYAFRETGGQFDGSLARVVVDRSGRETHAEKKEERRGANLPAVQRGGQCVFICRRC